MKLTFKTLLVVFFTFYAVNTFSQIKNEQIDSIINNTVKTDGPGAIVFIKQKGKVLYEKAFGKANIENNVDMSANNAFNIGSVSKEFTAMSVLQLLEKGKLSLEDNVNSYLPNYSNNGDKIKINPSCLIPLALKVILIPYGQIQMLENTLILVKMPSTILKKILYNSRLVKNTTIVM